MTIPYIVHGHHQIVHAVMIRGRVILCLQFRTLHARNCVLTQCVIVKKRLSFRKQNTQVLEKCDRPHEKDRKTAYSYDENLLRI